MPRPDTGPFRRGLYSLPTHRTCDHCHTPALRALGGYVKKSHTRMIWCCEKCRAQLTAAGLEIAA
jgi:hypothetical protein